ncbi:hypothetical protein GCM10018966_096270 [Streptomyces yanii]
MTVAVIGFSVRVVAVRVGRPGLALAELPVVEQRYRAVLAVLAGATVTEVAAQLGVSRQKVSGWKSRYVTSGLAGLADRSRRPATCPTSSHRARSGHETPELVQTTKKPRAADLGLFHGTGDENRTRALSLGILRRRPAAGALACRDTVDACFVPRWS